MTSLSEEYPKDYTPKTILKHMNDYTVVNTRKYDKSYVTDKKNFEKYLSYKLNNELFSYIITSSLRIKPNPIIFETFSNKDNYNVNNPYPNPYYKLEGNRIAINKGYSKTDYILLDYTIIPKDKGYNSKITYTVEDIYKGGNNE